MVCARWSKRVYIVPKGKRFDKDKHLVAWFMELPERCAC